MGKREGKRGSGQLLDEICCRIVDELNKNGITYVVGDDGEFYFLNSTETAKAEKIIRSCYRQQSLKGGMTMAEMTAAEAIGLLDGRSKTISLENLVVAANFIEQQAEEIEQAKAAIDTHSELAEHYKRREEQAEAECKRLRVCGNCRHFSTGYTGDYCVKANNRETLRQNTCRDWEMV